MDMEQSCAEAPTQELGQHWKGRIRPGLVQQAQGSHGTEGHSWDLQHRVPVAGQPQGCWGSCCPAWGAAGREVGSWKC